MSAPITPEVLWAQRSSADVPEKNVVFITITAPDIPKESLKLELTPTKLSFSGANKTYSYALELEFYAEVDVEESTSHHSGRGVEYKLRKKEAKDEFWPRLAKEPKRLQFIKTDFDKWVDEDEQEEAEELGAGMPEDGGMDFGGGAGGMPGGMGGMDMASMMQGMGGAGGAGGMPPGMDMASLMSSMGGGGAGMPDFSKMGAGEDEGDDDDLPELEDTTEKDGETPAAAPAGDKKIEEVK
ncbi:HSP20-like chaperone [Geopyxis carbonaria]|nr:HSP20-like chaperone [Geopyxis carbonaria]